MRLTQKEYELAIKSAKMGVLTDLIATLQVQIFKIEKGIDKGSKEEYEKWKWAKDYLNQQLQKIVKDESLVGH
jgi:hypothetical protein